MTPAHGNDRVAGAATRPRSRTSPSVPLVTGAISIGVGLMVLVGWALDIDVLKSVVSSLPSMKGNTAIAFVLTGTALLVAGRVPGGRTERMTGAVVGVLVGLFGLVVVGEYLFGGVGIDTLLFDDTGPYPGRPSPHTAVAFAVVGVTLLAACFRGRRADQAFAVLLAALGLVLLAALIGYAFGVDYLRGLSAETGMGVMTVLTFAVVWVGLAWLRPHTAAVGFLRSGRPSALLLRRFGPVILLAPPLLGVARLEGQRLGLYDLTFGVAMFTLATVLLLGSVVVLAGRSLDRADARRAEAEQLFRGLVESAPDATVVVDQSGTMVLASDQAGRLFGYQSHEMVGRPVEMLVPERHRNAHGVHRTGFLAHPTTRPMGAGLELHARHADGHEIPVEISLSPVETDRGVLVTAAVRDITGRREQEEQLLAARAQAVEASRQKSDFLAVMSHEIRTPMTAVIGMTELLLDTELSEDQRRFAETVHRSGRTLVSLINDILDFSKIEAGKIDLAVVDFDLGSLAEDVGEDLYSQADEKGVELTVSVDPDLPQRLRGDANRIRQVLLNLTSNAVKFTDHGQVVITIAVTDATPSDCSVQVLVQDSGIGIAPEVQAHVFDRFEQVDSSATRRHGGTGLGLTISQRLVRLMGGEIGLESAPGLGSTFSFTLTLPVAELAPARGERAFVDKRALVIVGSAANGEVLARELNAWGLATETARDDGEALALNRAATRQGRPFDLAVADLSGHDIDGFRLAHLMDPLPTVILSSAGERGAARGQAPHNVVAWLLKPLRRAPIRDAVAEGLSSTPAPAPSVRRPPMSPTPTGRVLVSDDDV